jgi:Flp pilus assembly protein TadD
MPDSGLDPAQKAIHVADAYFDSRNYERAREVLRRSLAEHPNDPDLLAQHARAEFLLDNYPAAAWGAYAALSAAPHDEMAMRIYALSLDGLGRAYDAMWMAWRTVTTHPNSLLAHRLYARLLQKSRQFPSALLAVDEALRLGPTDVDTLILRGSILHDLGRMGESDASYRQALTLDPGNAEALNNLGVNRLRRGSFGPALRGFLGAAGIDPTLGDLARRNIGVVSAESAQIGDDCRRSSRLACRLRRRAARRRALDWDAPGDSWTGHRDPERRPWPVLSRHPSRSTRVSSARAELCRGAHRSCAGGSRSRGVDHYLPRARSDGPRRRHAGNQRPDSCSGRPLHRKVIGLLSDHGRPSYHPTRQG